MKLWKQNVRNLNQNSTYLSNISMKIALFAAVPEEVGRLADRTNFMGIGRENATRALLRFMKKHPDEDFTILNLGTVGSHDRPVGTIMSIQEVVSAGAQFFDTPMTLSQLDIPSAQSVDKAILYSSDSFVSPAVYTAAFLDSIKQKADCLDMESSAVYSVAEAFGKPFVSFKIVSDNLDVTLDVWQQRVVELSSHLADFADRLFAEIPDLEFLL